VEWLRDRPVEGRKTVSVLFCDLVAFTQLAERLDPEALRGLMGEFFGRAAAEIGRLGGSVEKFIGDEVMAVFGVPAVREDDALRALRAALAVRACVAELDRETDATLEVRIGVNTGEVMTGDPAAGHSFVSGDPVAVGKRLEQAAAPGEILLGEKTYALVAHAVEVSQLGPLDLKGKAQGVAAYRLEALDPDAGAIARRGDTPFAGHQRELEWLRARHRQVLAGEGAGMVTIVGEPGIGKSRLARELLTGVEGETRTLVGRCAPHGEGETFSPVRELFRQVGRDEPELDGSSYEVFAAVRRLLEELSREGSVIVVFDDIHWAGETLLDLLEYLALRLGRAPVMVLCLARPDLVERRPQWLRDPGASLTLDALSASESEGLMEALGAPRQLRARIGEMAEGNPLFIEQLTLFAHEDRESVTMVDSIRGVLHARLDRLEPEARAVLECAAVVGRSFSLQAVLEVVPPQGRDAAQARLFELARQGLIRPDTGIPDEGFRFQHALIRDAVYEAMPKALRAEFHQAVAAHVAAGGGAAVLCGYHLERAYQLRRELGRRESELGRRAGRLLAQSAQEALGRSDVSGAISLFERARALLAPDDPELPPLLTALGDAHVKGGDMAAAERVLDEAITLATAVGTRSAELHARIERQFVREFTAPSTLAEQSVKLARDAIAELEGLGDDLALARAWWLASSDHLAACRWSERARAIEHALTYARRADAGLAMVGTLAGLLAQALLHGPTPVPDAIVRVERLPRELGLDGASRVAIDTALAGLLAMDGQIDRARRIYRDGITTTEEFGLRLRRAVQAIVGAQIELLAGNPGGAERELRASASALAEFGASTSAATHRAMLAEVLCVLERPEEAEAQARGVAAETTEDDLVTHVLWRSALVRALARRGMAAEARAPAQEALDLSAAMEFPFVRVAALTAAAEADCSNAPALLDQARSILLAKGNVVELARLDRLVAQLGRGGRLESSRFGRR
jgi:class 3 adenylate cyclase/tetratricopeptide (TPR) repeat protein